jgi:hypothetical protein
MVENLQQLAEIPGNDYVTYDKSPLSGTSFYHLIITARDGKKTWYYFEWGKAADQRRAAGIFTYTPAKNQTQPSHNKEAKSTLEIKKSQLRIDYQAIGTGYIPSHRFKHNFLDFYQDFVSLQA